MDFLSIVLLIIILGLALAAGLHMKSQGGAGCSGCSKSSCADCRYARQTKDEHINKPEDN